VLLREGIPIEPVISRARYQPRTGSPPA
jgi:hypothetical protein